MEVSHTVRTGYTCSDGNRVLHREDYHRVLMDQASRIGVRISLDSHVLSMSDDGKSVTLQNGKTLYADVVVGADGLCISHHDHVRPMDGKLTIY